MIEQIVVIFLYSVFVSFFIKFFDFCFNEGNIFDWYYKFIYEKFENKKPKLFKVLGGCIYCFGSWIYIMLFALLTTIYSIPFILIFIGLGINFISLMILENNLD